MPLISLEIAVSHIKQACDDKDKELRHPFFFLVGAGISSPPVPVASKIIQHCREIAKKKYELSPKLNEKTIDLYSYWFKNAYPQPIQRQKYLRSLIEGKPFHMQTFVLPI